MIEDMTYQAQANVQEAEIKIPKKTGRPKKYATIEELNKSKLETAKKAYRNKGYLFEKIHTLQKTYDLNIPYISRNDVKDKTKDELEDIIKSLMVRVGEVKKIKKLNQLEQKTKKQMEKKRTNLMNQMEKNTKKIKNVENQDFLPKTKYVFI